MDRCSSEEHLVNMSKDAAHKLKDIGFDNPEYPEHHQREYTDTEEEITS